MFGHTWLSTESRPHRGDLVPIVIIALGLTLAWAVTYLTGGTHRVFPHLFYIPIVFAAYRFGLHGGVITGAVAMVACGPLMPLDVSAGIMQSPENWVTRGVFFITIGAVAGLGSQSLRNRLHRSEKLHEDAVKSFVKTVDAKSPYTARHSERVAELAVAIARQLELSEQHVETIRWSALLHDVGKLWVPDSVINKRGPLSDAEWQIMRDHPIRSAEFIDGIADFHDYYGAARSHHERYDGAGYPDGLAGNEIPLEGRVLAVADAFEAMTSDRPYRPGLTFREAITELQVHSGTQFDPDIARACVNVIHSRPATLHQWRGVDIQIAAEHAG